MQTVLVSSIIDYGVGNAAMVDRAGATVTEMRVDINSSTAAPDGRWHFHTCINSLFDHSRFALRNDWAGKVLLLGDTDNSILHLAIQLTNLACEVNW